MAASASSSASRCTRAEAARLGRERAAQERDEVVVAERVEAEDLAAREQRRVHGERRVLGGRADEDDRPPLDVGKKRVLLRLVEAMNLVDEQDRALARGRPAASAPRRRCRGARPGRPSTALKRHELGLRLRGDDARRAWSCPSRAGPRGSSTGRDRARMASRRKRPAASRWRCPTYSSRRRGRIRSASGGLPGTRPVRDAACEKSVSSPPAAFMRRTGRSIARSGWRKRAVAVHSLCPPMVRASLAS